MVLSFTMYINKLYLALIIQQKDAVHLFYISSGNVILGHSFEITEALSKASRQDKNKDEDNEIYLQFKSSLVPNFLRELFPLSCYKYA